MPVTYAKTTARFEGACTVEEALEFSEWLRDGESKLVDLGACEHLHAALLQCLLALTPPLSSRPADPFLARAVVGLPDAPAASKTTRAPRRRRKPAVTKTAE